MLINDFRLRINLHVFPETYEREKVFSVKISFADQIQKAGVVPNLVFLEHVD